LAAIDHALALPPPAGLDDNDVRAHISACTQRRQAIHQRLDHTRTAEDQQQRFHHAAHQAETEAMSARTLVARTTIPLAAIAITLGVTAWSLPPSPLSGFSERLAAIAVLGAALAVFTTLVLVLVLVLARAATHTRDRHDRGPRPPGRVSDPR
jgi:hypothetical protein